MSSLRSKLTCKVMLAIATMALSAAMLHAGAKDTITMTALASTVPAPTISPVLNGGGGGSSNYFYSYAITDCSTPRIFPLEFLMTNTNDAYSEGATVSFNQAGGPGLTVSLPAPFFMNEASGTVSKSIQVTPPCTPGDYGVNIMVGVDPNNKVSIEHAQIHIQLRVGDPGSHCFLTDSAYNLLTDCAGATVELNGTFQIVVKANGRIVSTNPGQLYYNLIWTSGATRPITINLGPLTNLVPQGANAVHAMVFDAAGFTSDLDSWEMVNQNGTPCGPSGPCTVPVAAGQVLWVTWHLAFSQVGSPSEGISSTCGTGGVPVSASATLSSGGPVSLGGTPLVACSGGATGFLKPK